MELEVTFLELTSSSDPALSSSSDGLSDSQLSIFSHGDLFSTLGDLDVSLSELESIFSNGGGGSGSHCERCVCDVCDDYQYAQCIMRKSNKFVKLCLINDKIFHLFSLNTYIDFKVNHIFDQPTLVPLVLNQ